MTKNIIIGSGFTAILTKILSGQNFKVIGSHTSHIIRDKSYQRRKSIESNKLFSKKALSYGSLQFSLNHGKLHDRLTLGGNSNIWGGHINIRDISVNILNKFKNNNIIIKKLSPNNTGTSTNNKNIVQLQTPQNSILKAQYIPIKIQDGYMEKFYLKKNIIYIDVLNKRKLKRETIQVKKLFICVGTVQLIDLLYRSNFLKDGDVLDFTEFKHEFKFKLFNQKFNKEKTTVRYHFSRALGHFLGIQSYTKYLKVLKFIPFYVDQNFYKKRYSYKLQLKNKVIVEKNKKKPGMQVFGHSIHYCNMKINGININNYLSNINANIVGLGMSFVDQKEPGPIANDIILDIKKKLSH